MAALAIGLGTAPLAAHDLWIEPSDFAPAAGRVVGLRLQVGQDFAGEPLPLIPELVDQFVAVDAAGRRSVAGRRGSDPAGRVLAAGTSPVVIGYQSHASRVELPAAKFDAYLAEEGLEAIAALLRARGQADDPASEIFHRCAKSLLNARSLEDDRALGFTLELVVESDRVEGGISRVRLTYEGRPLAGALVVARHRGPDAERQAARTDAEGRIALRLGTPGDWLVKAVHMVPAPPQAAAQWASYWASLTFRREAGAQSDVHGTAD